MYAPAVEFYGGKVNESVLFLDGCSAHHTQQAEKIAADLGIRMETLPPNCTPILQPCDQYINSLFKKYYQDEWRDWYMAVGWRDATKSGDEHSNLRRAKEVEVNKWIANATARLIMSPDAIRASWRDTLIVDKSHLLHMAPYLWATVRSMLLPSDTCALNTILGHHKIYGNNFNISATQRKRKQPTAAESKELHFDGKEEKDETSPDRGKECVVIRLGSERYAAVVDMAVVAALKKRRVERNQGIKRPSRSSNKENVEPTETSAKRQRQSNKPEQPRPFKIRQAWET